jgi:hypothetical protein
VGGCQVQDIGAKCSQYTNNGTAEFGGYYAGGLAAGESYFISVNWITTDGSKTGTASKYFNSRMRRNSTRVHPGGK